MMEVWISLVAFLAWVKLKGLLLAAVFWPESSAVLLATAGGDFFSSPPERGETLSLDFLFMKIDFFISSFFPPSSSDITLSGSLSMPISSLLFDGHIIKLLVQQAALEGSVGIR